MLRYILRRLLMTLPTLVGISLVTFVLVHLAPGSPLGSEAGMALLGDAAQEELREHARAYSLHLPLFVNVDVEDVEKDTTRFLVLLRRPLQREFVRKQLVYRGGAAFPYLLPHLKELGKYERATVLEALDLVGTRMGIGDELEKTADREAFWLSFWDYYKMDYSAPRARRLVDRLVNFDDELARKELLRLDTFALPAVFEALAADGGDPRKVRTLLGLVEHATAAPGASFTGKGRSVEKWFSWWRRYEDEFTRCDSFCTVVGTVTKTRYARWVGRLVRLDFGASTRDGRPVGAKLLERLPVTLLVSMLALLVSYLVSVPLGVYSAVRATKAADRAITLLLFVLYSLPSFWVAIVLLRLFGGLGGLDLFPIQGIASAGSQAWPLWLRALDTARHLVLPVVCLSYVSFATLSRYQRSATLDVLGRDFVRTARAKGLSELKVLWRHVLRNSLIPVVTLLGMQVPLLIGGSVIVERIFGIEGMGLETFEAIRSRDYNWILAVAFITSILTVAGMLVADVLYAVVDPRISYRRRGAAA